MQAEVTYNAGSTYRFVSNPGLKFLRDKTQIVTDPLIIKAAQMTKGFSVRVINAPAPQPEAKRVKRVSKVAKKSTKTKSKKVRRSYDD